jgi:hypothetical protein
MFTKVFTGAKYQCQLPATKALLPATKALLPGTKALLPGTKARTANKALLPGTKARVVTATPRWTFTANDEHPELQYMHLQRVIGKHGGAYQDVRAHIHQKLGGYRAQDIAKARYDPDKVITYTDLLDKLLGASTRTGADVPIPCFYCQEGVLLVYRDVRHPKQWTLERIDNARGHVADNVVVACLACNVRRRTMYHERYVMTKQMVVQKMG